VAGIGPKIFQGRGARIALWINASGLPLSRAASIIRWICVILAVLAVYLGWSLAMSGAANVALVVGGSVLLVVALYIPDFSRMLSRAFDRPVDSSAGPGVHGPGASGSL
jgi:hypothetical protein